MKLAIVTDEISQDFSTACELASRWGVKAVEVRTVMGARVPRLPRQEWQGLRDTAESFGLEIVSIAPGLLKAPLDSPEFPQHTGRLAEDSFALASLLGVTRIVIFGGVKPGPAPRELPAEIKEGRWAEPPRPRAEEAPEEVLQALATLAEMAQTAGLTLLLENEPICYADTGLRTAEMVRQLSHPALRINWDPGNAFTSDELPFPDGYRQVKPFVSHVHVKDAVKEGAETRFVPLGRGAIDWPGQLDALRQDGYEGYLVVETHFAPKVQGSEECLRNLAEMLY